MTTILTREGPVDMVAVRYAIDGRPMDLTDHELDVALWLAHHDRGVSAAELERRFGVSERTTARIAKAPRPVDRHGDPIHLNS